MSKKQVATKEKVEYRKLSPAVDVEEYADKFVLRFELPGVKKEELKVSTLDDTLEIEADAHIEQEGSAIYSEFGSRTYKRSFRLGKDIKQDSIDASLENGILTIAIQRKEKAKPVSIEIH